MISRKTYWALGIVAVAVGMVILGGEHLLLGWLYFPLRVLPRITPDPAAVLLGIVCFAGFVGGLHLLIHRFLRRDQAVTSERVWSWRATLALSSVVLLLFVAGTAMVGATHQLVWLMSKRKAQTEPVFGIIEEARAQARAMSMSNSLHNIALSTQSFHDEFKMLPPGGVMTEEGELLHGWAIFIAPYLNFGARDGMDYSIPWNRPPNDRYYKCNLGMFVNPSIPGPYFDKNGFGYAHLAGNVHVLPMQTVKRDKLKSGHFPYDQLARSQQSMNLAKIKDGTANTILFGTVAERFKPWGHPANVRDPAAGINRSPEGFGAHPGSDGAIFAFCDGHVATLNKKIDPHVLKQLATPAGGEPPVE